MNDYVGPDSFPIVPSDDLPCCRLPFGVHRSICSALDRDDRWKDLAADSTLDLESEKVRWLHNRHRSSGKSCTSALLELLWKDKQITVENFLRFLEHLKLCVPLAKCLRDYLLGKISEEECTRSTATGLLTEDPRKPVS